MDACMKISCTASAKRGAIVLSQGEATMSTEAPTGESLTHAEIDAALRAMSAADWARARSLARVRAASVPGLEAADLLQEALVELLASQRVWRRGVPPLVTLKVAMHSIASNYKNREAEGPIDRFALVDVGAGKCPGEDGAPREVEAVDRRSPERIADARSEMAMLEALVAGDEDAQMVLLAWGEGLRGQPAVEEIGFDMKRYDAARKRLMRLLTTAKEGGTK
jgi:DNA-directed RNA polymerase specialized sigma24 family protein